MNIVPPGGKHYLIDFYDVEWCKLVDCNEIKEVFLEGVKKAGATYLNSYFHEFGQGYGITGIMALSESHISIHTWPENGYASIDIYMCGNSDPEKCLDVLYDYFKPKFSNIQSIERG